HLLIASPGLPLLHHSDVMLVGAVVLFAAACDRVEIDRMAVAAEIEAIDDPGNLQAGGLMVVAAEGTNWLGKIRHRHAPQYRRGMPIADRTGVQPLVAEDRKQRASIVADRKQILLDDSCRRGRRGVATRWFDCRDRQRRRLCRWNINLCS